AHMNLAHNAFEAGAPGRLRELLAQHRPQPGEADLRGFEWHYLNRLSPTDLLVLKGHTREVGVVAYSPDGKQIATACHDGSVKLWDAQSGQELHSLNAARAGSSILAYSPDSQRIVTSDSLSISRLKIWNAQTGQELHTIKLSLKPLNLTTPKSLPLSPDPCVAFSPDRKY